MMDIEKEHSNTQPPKKPHFSPYLFWDIKRRGFDFDKNRLLMIERVCSRGLEKDWREMLKYYGWETVKQEVVRIGWLDGRTLSFLSCIFDIPKERFKCYKNKRSRKNYWDS
ncbi:MAG: hypothetical protein LBP71_05950 [Spirochaetaceae bacterium]|jgi:hypothetical protein|nr:hypothetical protein [Spirochaetaceae bacterium]